MSIVELKGLAKGMQEHLKPAPDLPDLTWLKDWKDEWVRTHFVPCSTCISADETKQKRCSTFALSLCSARECFARLSSGHNELHESFSLSWASSSSEVTSMQCTEHFLSHSSAT